MSEQNTDKVNLTEELILENEELVQKIKESAETLSEPMSYEDFKAWLYQTPKQ